jgi:hypothetical protein
MGPKENGRLIVGPPVSRGFTLSRVMIFASSVDVYLWLPFGERSVRPLSYMPTSAVGLP